jgi:hypothetical protein
MKLLAVCLLLVLAGCQTPAVQQPYIGQDGRPVLCPFCGRQTIAEHLYYGMTDPPVRTETQGPFCSHCGIGIDVPGMLEAAEKELISKGLR